MSRLIVIAKSGAKDYLFKSPKLTPEEASRQRKLVEDSIGAPGAIKLPWASINGANVIAVKAAPERTTRRHR